ncbi:MAG TPA: hypothetical protein VNA30_01655 [Mycobacteriales bacterium]|nr:hypothetical protein [Mycobacteriales bacterium]
MRPTSARLRLVVLSVALAGVAAASVSALGAPPKQPPPVPSLACAPGSLPEQVQGRAPLADVATGRYAKGYTCNVQEISRFGTIGGFRVERYVDLSGNECAFYDSSSLPGRDLPTQGPAGTGTYVLDMKNPAKPVLASIVRTGAFQSPHETVRLNQRRGLLVATLSTFATNAGQVDVYDVSKDCRKPELLSSLPVGFLGHEAGFSPDGLTYWSASLYFRTLVAVDLTEPRLPRTVFTSIDQYEPHGVSLSDDGKTLYMAEAEYTNGTRFTGLTILDVSQVQARVSNPTVPIVSRLTWRGASTPQNATPFTRNGHRYVLETDEFNNGDDIGAARIIDIQNPKKPFVVSDLRLAVNQAALQKDLAADPGNDRPFQGYEAHYCTLPSRVDPYIVACSFLMSGLRVFDISDVRRPKQIAYHNRPLPPGVSSEPARAGSSTFAAPAYDEATGDIWYSDATSGFYVVRLAGPARRPKFAASIVNPGN